MIGASVCVMCCGVPREDVNYYGEMETETVRVQSVLAHQVITVRNVVVILLKIFSSCSM